MIAYDLKCGNNHTFEGWFDDHTAYEDQKLKGLISCPVCDDKNVLRIPSTFAIKSAPERSSKPKLSENAMSEIITRFIDENFDNVGCDFAKEALKIHYGAAEPRNIRGSSTNEEEKIMKEEGIEFFKFPVPSPPDPDS